MILIGGLATACFNTSNIDVFPFPEDKLSARIVQTIGDDRTDNRILLLEIDGVITGQGESFLFWDKEATTAEITKKLNKAARDDRIKAVVLRINSPGGGVTASDIVYRQVLDYKRKTRVPVVAVMMDVAASGGYYIACASDKIVAHPTTVTGSIGVIIYALGFNGLFEKIGMESRVIKSGELKDMGNPFDEFTEQERAVFQNVVDQMYDRFVNVVVENRRLEKARVREIADGRIYVGGEAGELGLVDRVGYLEDGVRLAMDEAGVTSAKVMIYTNTPKKELNVYSNNLVKAPEINSLMPSADMMLDAARPRIMYMWLGQ
ncbi:MAG: signal peptide peptidase SppA [Deltaproteobacteria bacterium]|nr:signal peptide peptidase SppA [Deltaproteobacteria bacterium]